MIEILFLRKRNNHAKLFTILFQLTFQIVTLILKMIYMINHSIHYINISDILHFNGNHTCY
jgi:hypothetical protein